ncbi:24901_t:CDS:2, partial [Gigaspora margarita]
DDDLFYNTWTEHNPAVYLTNTLPDLDDWDKGSFNINSELTVEQQNQVVDLLKETSQVYAKKKISKSGQTFGLEQTNLVMRVLDYSPPEFITYGIKPH